MKALRLLQSEGREVLVEADMPQPQPGKSELLVRIHAAGVTPTELLWYPTFQTRSGEAPARELFRSHEFSGIVAAIGEEVPDLEIGSEVFGMNDWFSDGAMAEYCIAPSEAVAHKPQGLSHTEAATVPIGALTAWQGLFDRAKLQSNERVLVHGGAGAVGIFAVQLARLHGANVTATVSQRNAELVSSLGARTVIDYRTSRFEEYARDMDVVFDTVGGATLDRSWAVLKPNGRMVTVAAGAEEIKDPRTKEAFFIVEPNRKQLVEMGSLFEKGSLRTIVDVVVPLSRAAEAYAGTLARQGRGKVVVDLIHCQPPPSAL